MNYTFDILDYKIFAGSEHYLKYLRDEKGETLLSNNKYKLLVSSKVLTLYHAGGELVWDKPVICPGIPNDVLISENRLLITTNSEDYHAWGHLGPAIILDLETGNLIKEIKGSHGKALSGGRFIIGLEGYDVFDTWLYNEKGEMIQQWRSCGHYVIGQNDDIIVIEQDRITPTNSHVVRLCLDGKIERGSKLRTNSASNPIQLPNGDIIFDNSGILRVLDKSLTEVSNVKLLEISERNAWMYYSRNKYDTNNFFVYIMERSDGKKHPIEYKTHLWKIKIKAHNNV